MKQHRMQHTEPPTWCIDCSTFDEYAVGECDAEPTGKFNSDENFDRMLGEIFGPATT